MWLEHEGPRHDLFTGSIVYRNLHGVGRFAYSRYPGEAASGEEGEDLHEEMMEYRYECEHCR